MYPVRIKRLLVTAVLIAPLFIAAARVDLGIAVGTPPPPPPATAVITPVGPAPGPEYIWVPGYWDWVGGSWVWVDGRWMLPPHRRAIWVAPAIEFRLHRGHWR
jgi:hypothetical protein